MSTTFPLATRLDQALRRRRNLLQTPEAAVRLFSGGPDGVAGLVVEKYASVAVFQCHEGLCPLTREQLAEVAAWYLDYTDVSSVYLKTFPRDRSFRTDADRKDLYDPRPFAGAPAAPEIVVREADMRLIVRPYDGYATGLFLDQRENRAAVRRLARDRRVLNLFAYTCSFSVAAGLGGASGTVSIDISRKALDWGRRNFELNGLLDGADASASIAEQDENAAASREETVQHDTVDANKLKPSAANVRTGVHRFYPDPADAYLRRAGRRGQLFDLVILDPPSFARERKKSGIFNLRKDLPELIRLSAAVLTPGGRLLLSCNLQEANEEWLLAQVRKAGVDRSWRRLTPEATPADFVGDPTLSASAWVGFE